MFTPSLSNHAERQVDFSSNNANFHIQFTFSRLEICPITPSRFPLGGPLERVSHQRGFYIIKLIQYEDVLGYDAMAFALRPPPRGKRDGVIGHISRRENVN